VSLLFCLPILAYVFLFLGFRLKGMQWRVSSIHAAMFWGVIVTVLTEALSAFHALTPHGLAIGWLFVDIGAAIYLSRFAHNLGRTVALSDAFASGKHKTSQFTRNYSAWLAAAGALVILSVGLTAVMAPPNTQDSLVYHMPRIVHWLHNQSVSVYPTYQLRQLKMPPWSEYAMLTLHALSGGDWLDNLVQWFAMLGSVIGVSLVAKLLGANSRGQLLAALMCACIPQGILEASGSKNDYVVAFWLVVLTYYLLAFKQDRAHMYLLGAGGALGLACLTKATAFFFAPPVIVAIGLMCQWNWAAKYVYLRYLILAGTLALGLNSPQFMRNYQLFGTPLGPAAEIPPNGFNATNSRFGPSVTASNVVRNVALHLGTPIPIINTGVENIVTGILSIFGESVNDPGTTWDYTQFQVPAASRHEALAGNPLHCFLVMLTLVVLFSRWHVLELRASLLLSIGLIAAFVLFCAVLKWQPWHTRLHLPLFVLWSAVSGTVLAKSWSRPATAGLGVLLLLVAAPFVLANQIRPLSGGFNVFNQPRAVLYFADRRDLMSPYTAAARYVLAQGCEHIGLVTAAEPTEYPLLVLLGDQMGVRDIQHLDVRNPSRIYARDQSASPLCAVVCPNCSGDMLAQISSGTHLASFKAFENVVVLTRNAGIGTTGNACSFAFSGWYGKEVDGSVWWRWSAGKGEIDIAVATTMEATMSGQLGSIEQPNTVDILVNGNNEATIQIGPAPAVPAAPFDSLPLHLKAGVNRVEFVSHRAAIRIPSDARLLAISIRNFQAQSKPDAGCSFKP
jgi:4-amino-4-deoxy-L-arabinose transferase-like glycosyltransferase